MVFTTMCISTIYKKLMQDIYKLRDEIKRHNITPRKLFEGMSSWNRRPVFEGMSDADSVGATVNDN